MALVLNEEQQMLRESARGFLQEHAPVAALRKLRDDRDALGFSRPLWQQIIELGWPGILISEDFGGLDFGHVGMGQIMKEGGRTLTASPLYATAILGATAIALAGSEAQKKALLPAIVEGRQLLAFAVDEGGRHHDLVDIALPAQKNGAGYVLNGSKHFVVDGHVADQLVVAARTAGKAGEPRGISLFLVDAHQTGVVVERVVMADTRNWASVHFNDAAVGSDALLGEVDAAGPVVEQILAVGNAHVAAELQGIAEEVLERTVQYLKERKQFGVIIGTFQALQHRAAHLFSEIELVKSVALKALQALDDQSPEALRLVSVAKAKASAVAELATNESVQLHGGIGMTDEFDIGFYLKRARTLQQLFGDERYHLQRFAQLS
ncbi:MAG: acyl-CoA dehydrogenase family protein, partial [Porticoccaceae bacterium]